MIAWPLLAAAAALGWRRARVWWLAALAAAATLLHVALVLPWWLETGAVATWPTRSLHLAALYLAAAALGYSLGRGARALLASQR